MPAFPKLTAYRERVDRRKDKETALRIARLQVWVRDEGCCQNPRCGVKVSKGGFDRRGEVHHVVARSLSKAKREDPDNMVLTCARCHADITGHRLAVAGTATIGFVFAELRD